MEVRLSDFAQIVGTTTATVRNAIQLNKLPFLDTLRNDAETANKIARRTYGVGDAFAWFLQDMIEISLRMGTWAIAGSLQSSWQKGLRLYIRDRLDGKDTSADFLFFQRTIPKASEILANAPTWSFSNGVGPLTDEPNSFQHPHNPWPIVVTIRLDQVFEVFEKVLEGRGWRIVDGGFEKIESCEV